MMGGHTRIFKSIVYNLFGHTDYKHLLLAGDSKKLEELELFNRTNINIGDYIITKPIRGKIYEGYVYKLAKKYVYYKLNDKKGGIAYQYVDKIKKNKKKLIKTKKLSSEEIKKKLKINDIIYVRLKGKLQKGKVLSINKSRASILMEDNRKWYIPYNMIIIPDCKK